MKKFTGFWFTFSPESNKSLGKIMKDLADEFNQGKTFIPHLSFYGYVLLSPAQIKTVVNKLSTLIKPFVVGTKGMHFDEPVHKTLFIETEVTESMRKAVEYMESEFGQEFVFKPHVSLIYKQDLPLEIRRKLSSEINIPQEVFVDSISYYNPPEGKQSARYFDSWPEPVRVEL